ncbi:MAG TPA: hypothetical protein VGM19_03505 [Armatimonadota bacterium]|jgi:hypothetical protein
MEDNLATSIVWAVLAVWFCGYCLAVYRRYRLLPFLWLGLAVLVSIVVPAATELSRRGLLSGGQSTLLLGAGVLVSLQLFFLYLHFYIFRCYVQTNQVRRAQQPARVLTMRAPEGLEISPEPTRAPEKLGLVYALAFLAVLFYLWVIRRVEMDWTVALATVLLFLNSSFLLLAVLITGGKKPARRERRGRRSRKRRK